METDIHFVADYNKLKEMKKLLKKGVNINEKDDEFGATPLHGAIAHDNEEMALLLLENGADASIQDNEGLTALHYAAEHNMIHVAKIILKNTPKTINMVSKNDVLPLWTALMNDEEPFDMIKLLLENGADKNYGAEGSKVTDLLKMFNDDEITKLFNNY